MTSCMVVRNSETSAAAPLTTTPITDWKQELRAEIMKDVKEQMSNAILEEMRAGRSMAPSPLVPAPTNAARCQWVGLSFCC